MSKAKTKPKVKNVETPRGLKNGRAAAKEMAAEVERSKSDDETVAEAACLEIQEGNYGLQVRSDWQFPGEKLTPGEYNLCLGGGGPALRLTGDLDEHGSPYTARLEWQDWFKPWTEVDEYDTEALIEYAKIAIGEVY